MNAVCGENGSGKSTFCAFVLAMLYGLPAGGRKGGGDREKYAPWQGGAFGGSLVFETCGGQYCVTRTFGRRPSDDTFDLQDLRTGLPSFDFSSKIGQELFHLDRESFVRTAFIGQQDCATRATDDVEALIADLQDQAGDMGSCEDALQRLRAAESRLAPGRANGSLRRLADAIAEAEGEIASGAALQGQLLACVLRQEEQGRKRAQMERDLREAEGNLREALAVRELLSAAMENEPRQFPLNVGERSRMPALPFFLAGTGLGAAAVPLLVFRVLPFAAFLLAGALFFLGAGFIFAGAGVFLKNASPGRGRKGAREGMGKEAAHSAKAGAGAGSRAGQEKEAACGEQIAALHEKTALLREGIFLARDQEARLEREMEEIRTGLEEREDAQDRLAHLRAEREKEEVKYRQIRAAGLYLQRARESMAARHKDSIRRGFAGYWEGITGRSAAGVQVDASSLVTVGRMGRQRQAGALGAGYGDLAGICLRLALADAMYPPGRGERPPLILDDPLVNLDDEKTEGALRLLRDISAQWQILYVTCSIGRGL